MHKVVGISGALQVCAGEEHLLILCKDGKVRALGGNKYYQLGNAGFSDANKLESEEPILVDELEDIQGVSAMDNTSFALGKDGTVWAWGSGNNGMTGDGSRLTSGMYAASISAKKSPVQVKRLTNIKAISGAMALSADGSIYAWGKGYSGRIGNGTFEDQNLPVRVAGIKSAKQISAYKDGGAALLKDGSVWCWGTNYKGQLGTGIPSSKIYQGSKFEKSNIPSKVIGLEGVKQISGHSSLLALMSSGIVMGWGWGEIKALGPLGKDVTSSPVKVFNLTAVNAVKAGNGFGFALMNNGSVVGWGANMTATGVYKQVSNPIVITKSR